MSASLMAGIFVGGRSRRMGGVPKGLLVAPSGETIVDRWLRIFEGHGVPCILVGEHPAYGSCRVARVADDPRAEGPLGGLLALLAHAGNGAAIAVACDMPHVSERLARRLVAAPPAPIVAARRGGRWEPFFARYDIEATLPAACRRAHEGMTGLQGLLDSCGASELIMGPDEHRELGDWDAPEDVSAAPFDVVERTWQPMRK